MNELIEFLTSKEIVVVYIVAAVACLLCFIIYLIDKNYYKRKQRHNTRELNKLVEEVNEIVEQEEYEEVPVEVYETPVLSPVVEEYIAKKDANVELIQSEQPIVKEELVEEIEQIEETVTKVPTTIEVETLEEEVMNVEDLVLSTMTEEPAEYKVEPETLSVEDVMPIEVEPEVETTATIAPKEEELEYTTIEPNRQQAQEELMRLTEELERAEQESKTINLTSYEEDQEENAIISLEELEKKSKEMYESNEITQYADEGNEPISLEDLERRMNAAKEEIIAIEETSPVITEEPIITTVAEFVEELENAKVELADLNTQQAETLEVTETIMTETIPAKPLSESYQVNHKFERSPVISPIYGIERHSSTEDIALENTANYEKLDEEIKKTNEFLMTLRELQKNLD